ncbi:hypothetical protein B0H13DRAFT_1898558 [Mycena leptocephala]|nr:hypothetical protein B0H13DRAFT_1898558 [Mycena leptocephala]
MSLCIRARGLLGLCAMSGGALDHDIMNSQAEIHWLKSEYVEACTIHTRILDETSTQDPYSYGFALLNVAEIDVMIGAPKDEVQRNCETARRILSTIDFQLREGNSLAAKTIFKRCLTACLEYSQIQTCCLEQLGDASCWGDLDEMSTWTTIFLNDEHTATNLFTVALEGFTQMDIHRSRAECMLQLGEISKGHGDLLKAVGFWERARPLFEHSLQAIQVQYINGRLAGISKDVLKHHRNNLACLAELNAPSGTMYKLKNDLSDVADLDKVEIGDEKESSLIAA